MGSLYHRIIQIVVISPRVKGEVSSLFFKSLISVNYWSFYTRSEVQGEEFCNRLPLQLTLGLFILPVRCLGDSEPGTSKYFGLLCRGYFTEQNTSIHTRNSLSTALTRGPHQLVSTDRGSLLVKCSTYFV